MMKLGKSSAGSWQNSRVDENKVTSALSAATSALARAVEAKEPSRVSVLRVLLQAQEAITAAETCPLAYNPSKTFVELIKQLALSALWCTIRLGARGGPIRRRALDCVRRAGKLAGSFTLLGILADLQEYIRRDDASLIAGATEDTTDPAAAAATVMGEVVKGVHQLSREDASDAVMFLLNVLGPQSTQAKEEATAAAAAIILKFTVEEKIITIAAEWALGEASSVGVNSAALAVAVAGILYHKTATDDFARAAAKTFADVADSELEVKLWAIAMAKATVTSIAQDMPSGMKKARMGDQEYQLAMARLITAGGIREARVGSHWPLIAVLHIWRKRLQYGADFIRLAIETLARHLDDYQGLELGAETIYVGLLQGTRPSVLTPFLPVLVSMLTLNPSNQYEDETPYTQSFTGLALAAVVEILRQLGPDVATVMSEKKTGSISNPTVTELPATELLLDAARRLLESQTPFVQEGAATLLAALAAVSPLSRVAIITETIQNLRLADLELATNPEGETGSHVPKDKKTINHIELQKVSGYSLAIALLVDEATSYPGVPSPLLDQCVDDAQALLKPHSMTVGQPNPFIMAQRRRAGWTLLTALGRSGLSNCFSDERMPALVSAWIKELSFMEGPGEHVDTQAAGDEIRDSASSLGEMTVFSPGTLPSVRRSGIPPPLRKEQAAVRTASLAALHACIQSTQTREFELVAMSLCGSAAIRIAELDPGLPRDLALPELNRILVCVEALPPSGPAKDICFHVALLAEAEAIKRRKKVLKAEKKTKGRRRGRKITREKLREKLHRNQNNIIALFNSQNSQNLNSDALMRISAGAVAGITCLDTEECADFLEDMATKKLDVSTQFVGEVCLQVIRRLQPAKLLVEPRIMATMQVLMRRALLSDVQSSKRDLLPLTMMEMIMGRKPTRGENSDGLFVHDQTIRTVAETYRQLGRKGGFSLWSGLVDSVADMIAKSIDQEPHIAAACSSILGHLLATPMSAIHASHTITPEAMQRVSIRGAEAIASALEGGTVQVQVAAASSMSRTCIGIAERADRLLPLLLSGMLFEKGNSDVLVHLNDADLTAIRVDLEGSGENLADIGEGTAALLLALKELRPWKLGESVKESTREIAVELVSWKVDRAPRTRAAGLTCVVGTWAAMNADMTASAASIAHLSSTGLPSLGSNSPTLLPFEDFWSPELPSSFGRTAICETLMYRGGVDISEARYAAVDAVIELLQGAGPALLLENFPELPEALFVALESGCDTALQCLELLAAADAPGRFGFWLQLCRNVFYGGLLGVRTTGAGGPFDHETNRLQESKKPGLSTAPADGVANKPTGVPAREEVKYARWQGDYATRGSATRILRISVEAAIGASTTGRPDHVNEREAARKTAQSWVDERLVEQIGRICQMAITACATSMTCPVGATEGALILRTMVPPFAKTSDPASGGGIRLISGYVSQISASIHRLLVTPQMPEVVQAAALAASSIILSSCKVSNLDAEKLLQALFGNQIHQLHRRFQYDILTEQAGAQTTIAVVSCIGMVVSEAIRNDYRSLLEQLKPYFPTLYRLCIGFLGDFVSMFGSGPIDVAVNGGSLTVSGASVELIRSVFVKNAADIIFAACVMRPFLSEADFSSTETPVEWVCDASPGAALASQPAAMLFSTHTRDMLLSGCVWWITVGLTKSNEQAARSEGFRWEVLERCVAAIQTLLNWNDVDANVNGFTEALISLSAVNLAASSVLASRILKQEAPKAILPPDPIGEGALSVCLLALEQVAVFSQREFIRRTLPVAALDGLAHLILISSESKLPLETVAFPGLYGLFVVLENPSMDGRSRAKLRQPANRFLASIVATFTDDSSSEHSLAAARRLCMLVINRVREGLETPQSLSVHLSLLCCMAIVSREQASPKMTEIETLVLQIIHFCLSSSGASFVDATLASYDTCQFLFQFLNLSPSDHPHSDSLATIWSRIGELALREHPNLGASNPGSLAQSTHYTSPSLSLKPGAPPNKRETSLPVRVMLQGHQISLKALDAPEAKESIAVAQHLSQMRDSFLSIVLSVLLGRLHTPREQLAKAAIGQLAECDKAGIAMFAVHYIGERRELLNRILDKSSL